MAEPSFKPSVCFYPALKLVSCSWAAGDTFRHKLDRFTLLRSNQTQLVSGIIVRGVEAYDPEKNPRREASRDLMPLAELKRWMDAKPHKEAKLFKPALVFSRAGALVECYWDAEAGYSVEGNGFALMLGFDSHKPVGITIYDCVEVIK